MVRQTFAARKITSVNAIMTNKDKDWGQCNNCFDGDHDKCTFKYPDCQCCHAKEAGKVYGINLDKDENGEYIHLNIQPLAPIKDKDWKERAKEFLPQFMAPKCPQKAISGKCEGCEADLAAIIEFITTLLAEERENMARENAELIECITEGFCRETMDLCKNSEEFKEKVVAALTEAAATIRGTKAH
jgi:hypothetical protein